MKRIKQWLTRANDDTGHAYAWGGGGLLTIVLIVVILIILL